MDRRPGQDGALKPLAQLFGGSVIYDLIDPLTVVGRGEDCDLILKSRSVSTRHAEISIDEKPNGDRHKLNDLGSRNGTFVNDKRVWKTTCRLAHGDAVRFGYDSASYLFLLPGKPLPLNARELLARPTPARPTSATTSAPQTPPMPARSPTEKARVEARGLSLQQTKQMYKSLERGNSSQDALFLSALNTFPRDHNDGASDEELAGGDAPPRRERSRVDAIHSERSELQSTSPRGSPAAASVGVSATPVVPPLRSLQSRRQDDAHAHIVTNTAEQEESEDLESNNSRSDVGGFSSEAVPKPAKGAVKELDLSGDARPAQPRARKAGRVVGASRVGGGGVPGAGDHAPCEHVDRHISELDRLRRGLDDLLERQRVEATMRQNAPRGADHDINEAALRDALVTAVRQEREVDRHDRVEQLRAVEDRIERVLQQLSASLLERQRDLNLGELSAQIERSVDASQQAISESKRSLEAVIKSYQQSSQENDIQSRFQTLKQWLGDNFESLIEAVGRSATKDQTVVSRAVAEAMETLVADLHARDTTVSKRSERLQAEFMQTLEDSMRSLQKNIENTNLSRDSLVPNMLNERLGESMRTLREIQDDMQRGLKTEHDRAAAEMGAATDRLAAELRQMMAQSRREAEELAIETRKALREATSADMAALRESTAANIMTLREAASANMISLREATTADITQLRSMQQSSHEQVMAAGSVFLSHQHSSTTPPHDQSYGSNSGLVPPWGGVTNVGVNGGVNAGGFPGNGTYGNGNLNNGATNSGSNNNNNEETHNATSNNNNRQSKRRQHREVPAAPPSPPTRDMDLASDHSSHTNPLEHETDLRSYLQDYVSTLQRRVRDLEGQLAHALDQLGEYQNIDWVRTIDHLTTANELLARNNAALMDAAEGADHESLTAIEDMAARLEASQHEWTSLREELAMAKRDQMGLHAQLAQQAAEHARALADRDRVILECTAAMGQMSAGTSEAKKAAADRLVSMLREARENVTRHTVELERLRRENVMLAHEVSVLRARPSQDDLIAPMRQAADAVLEMQEQGGVETCMYLQRALVAAQTEAASLRNELAVMKAREVEFDWEDCINHLKRAVTTRDDE